VARLAVLAGVFDRVLYFVVVRAVHVESCS
jgi:hypothetical protein